MQAIILAAGMGKRLGCLTENNTKCMVDVNGVTLIERMLKQLEKHGLSRIVIVIGYKGKVLKEYISTLNIQTPITYVENTIYDKTNNIYSLYMAREYLCEEDALLLESDLIFEDDVLNVLLEDERDTLALVDKYESWMDGTCIKIGDNDSIEAFVPGKKFVFEDIPYYYKTVNIYKFSKRFSNNYYIPFLTAYSQALGNNEYYEQVLRVITMLDKPHILAKKLEGQLWYEIDDVQDLDIASSMFTNSADDKLKKIQKRYGGYWRYPRLIDFCYLVNPFYPPQRLLNEVKANMDALITQYPSGLEVNSLLAAKNFGVNKDYILVGNGAAELINCLMRRDLGKIGIAVPTFEEYINRYSQEKIVKYEVNNENFSYTASDLISFYEEKEINTLLLINPDNPSGNYISKEGLSLLLNWCKKQNITAIVDESFVDFAEEDNNSLLHDSILEEYSNLVVVKSISKSYGVPGVRLGVIASSDRMLITELKREVSIWNINSLGEFYMQIEEKYSSDYKKSLVKTIEARKDFCKKLNDISEIRVISSQANYIMMELLCNKNATDIAEELLEKYNIFVKDLSGKICVDKGQYLRVAVRTQVENDYFIKAIKMIVS